ncbi:MAG TPA: S8 family serine peptidase [Gaiellaceae bacterium]
MKRILKRLFLFACLVALASPASALARGFLPSLPGPRQLAALERGPVLVQLRDGARAPAGATAVAPSLRIWRVDGAALPRLVRAGAVVTAEPDRRIVPERSFDFTDPLVPTEWWRPTVGADRATPPGPGKPVTVIDSGLDLSHPEFARRPNTTALNAQKTTGSEDEGHGTAVSSVIGAPADGQGLVGIYPQAVLRSWDASASFGEGASLGAEIAGLNAAMKRGPGVINISLGSEDRSPLEEETIMAAVRAGNVIVASAGNAFQNGNAPQYPADYHHVLTVAATNQQNTPASFSNASLAVDLAAPGEDIPVALPLAINPTGYDVWDGTSFSAPMVSGAAAWVWAVRPTLANTQVFDLMRFSAHDIWSPGYDRDTGFGLLDVPAALAATPLAVDPQEPNEDVFLVKPGGLSPRGTKALTAPGRRRASIVARLDVAEDPEDVYRVFVPARGRVRVVMRPSRNAELEIWGPRTQTVNERGAARRRDLQGTSKRASTATDSVVVANKTAKGEIVYADVFLASKVLDASYTLTIAPA